MKISVIIPVYNVEAYLGECLDSVLQQDMDDMEILCVDDGGTDGSRAILEQYAARESRIHIISYGKNGGLPYARNRAMEQAKGEYIFFLDSDDKMMPHVLDKLWKIADEHRLDALLYEMEMLYEDGLEQKKEYHIDLIKRTYPGVHTGADLMREFLSGTFWTAWIGMWRRSFLEEHHIVFHEGVVYEDAPFVLKVMMLAKRTMFLSEPCYIYRRRASSITTESLTMKHLEGRLKGALDMLRIVLDHPNEMTKERIRVLSRFFVSQQNTTQEFILRLGKDHPQDLPVESPEEELLLQLMLQTVPRDPAVRSYLSREMEETLRAQQDIIVYGAGKIGQAAIRLLSRSGIQNYYLAVTKRGKRSHGIGGGAYELHELADLRETACVIVAVGKRLRPEMMAEAQKLGFQHMMTYDELVR